MEEKIIPQQPQLAEAVQEKAETAGEQLLPQQSCTFVVEVTLPQEVDLTSEQQFSSQIVNKGTCTIPLLTLALDSGLADQVEIPAMTQQSLKEGDHASFVLIRKQEVKDKPLGRFTDLFTGSVVLAKPTTDILTGSFHLVGHSVAGEELFAQELPLRVKVPGDSYRLTPLFSGLLGVVVLAVLVFLGRIIWRKRLRKS